MTERSEPSEGTGALVAQVAGMVQKRVAWHLSRVPSVVHLSEELMGAANVALAGAARRYSPKHGASFATFARYAVDGAILDTIDKELRERDVRAAATTGMRWGAFAREPDGEDTLDPRTDDEEAADRKLRRAMSKRAMGAALAFAAHFDELCDKQVSPEQVAVLRPLVEAIARARSRLSARDQQIVTCLYDEGLDLLETAGRVGLAYPTTKVRHGKILLMLRESLAGEGFSSLGGPG